MKNSEANPQRELFVAMYATKLKELRGTPYALQSIRDLERIAERRLEAVERALVFRVGSRHLSPFPRTLGSCALELCMAPLQFCVGTDHDGAEFCRELKT